MRSLISTTQLNHQKHPLQISQRQVNNKVNKGPACLVKLGSVLLDSPRIYLYISVSIAASLREEEGLCRQFDQMDSTTFLGPGDNNDNLTVADKYPNKTRLFK